MLVDLKQKSQVTIPSELVKLLELKVGDKLDITEKDGKLIITPVIIVPKNQGWYYSKKWQKIESEVDKQIEDGRLIEAKDKEDLFKGLGLDEI